MGRVRKFVAIAIVALALSSCHGSSTPASVPVTPASTYNPLTLQLEAKIKALQDQLTAAQYIIANHIVCPGRGDLNLTWCAAPVVGP
jgi:hypothetical protein